MNTPLTAAEVRAYELAMPLAFRRPPQQRLARAAAGFGFVAAIALAAWRLDLNPLRILLGLRYLGWMVPMLFPPSAGGWFWDFAQGLGETLAMAFLGTFFGAALAVPLGFVAARNVVGNRVIHTLLRRAFDVIRGINTMIWALMFVHVSGLGPFAGIMAITITDMATLAKLYAEAIENIDRRPIEGAISTGANRLQVIRYAFVPQLLPVILSNALYFYESNVRSASVLGVLGAGGIGMRLYDRIRIMNWHEASFIILMILVTVSAMDTLSKAVRARIVSAPEARP